MSTYHGLKPIWHSVLINSWMWKVKALLNQENQVKLQTSRRFVSSCNHCTTLTTTRQPAGRNPQAEHKVRKYDLQHCGIIPSDNWPSPSCFGLPWIIFCQFGEVCSVMSAIKTRREGKPTEWYCYNAVYMRQSNFLIVFFVTRDWCYYVGEARTDCCTELHSVLHWRLFVWFMSHLIFIECVRGGVKVHIIDPETEIFWVCS